MSAVQNVRQSSAAARRRSRIAASLDGAAAVEPDAAALAALAALARGEARRIPDTLRQSLDADDVAQSAAVRLLSSDAGRLTLAALTSASDVARDAARRHARGAVRSIVGHAIRDGSTAADVAADALTAETTTGALAHRSGAEALAVAAALAADGAAVRIDRDDARRTGLEHAAYVGRGTGVRAARRAGLDAAAADAIGAEASRVLVRHNAGRGGVWAAVREQTTPGYVTGTAAAVRIIRETSLERLLTSALHVPLPTSGNGAASAGRTDSGVLADRETSAAFRGRFASHVRRLSAETTGRGAARLATVAATLPARDWTADAAAARVKVAAALDALAAADAARLAADALAADHPGKGNAAAARAARTAHVAAERETAHVLDVWHVLNAAALDAAAGRRPTLASLAVLTLSTSADSLRTGAGRRRAQTGTADRSTLSTAVLLDVLAGSRDTAGALSIRLRSVLADAADAAVLDALAEAPQPSARLARHRSRDAAAGRLPAAPPSTWSASTVHRAARLADAAAVQRRRDAAAADAYRRTFAAVVAAVAVWAP